MSGKPHKLVYGIRKAGERDQWTQSGVAFPNKDNSLTVVFDYVPADLTKTKIHIRDPKPKEQQEAKEA